MSEFSFWLGEFSSSFYPTILRFLSGVKRSANEDSLTVSFISNWYLSTLWTNGLAFDKRDHHQIMLITFKDVVTKMIGSLRNSTRMENHQCPSKMPSHLGNYCITIGFSTGTREKCTLSESSAIELLFSNFPFIMITVKMLTVKVYIKRVQDWYLKLFSHA